MPLALEPRVYYALKCLVCLAESNTPRPAKDLAAATGIPPSETAKILYQLTWAGLISSRRGQHGGYWLRRPPTRIRVRDVMSFFHPPQDDAAESQDSILRVWAKRGGAIHPGFESLSLAQLVRENQRILNASARAPQRRGSGFEKTKLRRRLAPKRRST